MRDTISEMLRHGYLQKAVSDTARQTHEIRLSSRIRGPHAAGV